MESNINKKENKARKIALWAIACMVLIWSVLGVMSFQPREGYDRPQTRNISFQGQTALKGKQVFQSYNCMDCHTIVGNGAYFAPDLTNIYKDAGPAWLLAYLGSPGTYPTQAIVNIQLNQLIKDGAIDVKNLDEYYVKYPKAKERVEERGGIEALMPNLQFKKEEMDALVAFFKYTQKLNTAGWPPEILAKKAVIERVKEQMEEKSGIVRKSKAVASNGASSNSEETEKMDGYSLSENLGCIACHSIDGSKKIGPSWKGIFDHNVQLANGKSVKIDEDYLRRAILQPNEEVVHGFPAQVMPSYEGAISEEQVKTIIDYIKTLK